MIPMEACHILLGHPWMYDREVIRDGFLNIYSFCKGGKKLTLVPLAPSKLSKCKPQKNLKRSGLLLHAVIPF